MADVGTFTGWSSTNSSNSPSGATVIGAGLDDNLREIQAQVAAWRDGTGYGILTCTSVSGTNTITASTSPAPTLGTNQKFLLIPSTTNTGAVTLNLNSGGAKNVYAGNSALVGGELHANIPVILVYDGTQFQVLGPVFKQPTRQVLTSGSAATYTTPTGCARINVRMVGGGGGGSANATNSGGAGNDTTFGTLTAAGGAGGAPHNGAGGTGGAGTNGDINITGASGTGGATGDSSTLMAGGNGGSSVFGGAGSGGAGNAVGNAASTNSGSGGGGSGSASNSWSGAGGGAGAYVEKLITAPSATYTYTVGTGGSGGAAGTVAGGAGAAGIIIVDEFYN